MLRFINNKLESMSAMRLTHFLICFFVIGFIQDVIADDYKIGAVNAIRILEQSPQAERMRNLA